MTETPQIRVTVARKAWIAIRFIVFGIGGFLTLWISWLSALSLMDPHGERFLLLVAVPLSFVGALMMLYGAGQWDRWGYLWVFSSVPLIVTPLALLAEKYPAADWLFAKPLVILFFALPMPVSYVLVRGHHRRCEVEAKKASI